MTAPTSIPPRPLPDAPRQIKVDLVAKLHVRQVEALIADRFADLVTVALADATTALPRPHRRLLRGDTWREDWSDALLWAEGELLVASERMAWERDPRLDRTNDQLRAVRTRLDESRRLIAAAHRRMREDTIAYRTAADTDATARKWLTDAFPDEFDATLRQVLTDRELRLPAREYARDVFDSIEAAHVRGWLSDPITDEVRHLMAMSPVQLRKLAAADVQHQDDRVEGLNHPLMLRRWSAVLRQMAEDTCARAGSASPNALGATPAALRDADLPSEEAFAMLRARRFLAAVIQRRTECARTVQRTVDDLERVKHADPHRISVARAKNHARMLLAAAHPHEFDALRERLRRYESTPGVIDTTLLPDDHRRGRVKRDILRTLVADSPGVPRPRPANDTWTAAAPGDRVRDGRNPLPDKGADSALPILDRPSPRIGASS